jgi:hypothetical protein
MKGLARWPIFTAIWGTTKPTGLAARLSPENDTEKLKVETLNRKEKKYEIQ